MQRKFYFICQKFLQLLFFWVLYFRSFFIKDRTLIFIKYVVPSITLIFISLQKLYPLTISEFSACYFFVSLGIQLISYDLLGSKIASSILDDTNPVLSLTMLMAFTRSKNPI